jgi:glutaredoxin 2
MILKESEIDQDNIIPVLGKPFKEPEKLFTATGSSFYFVKEFNDLKGDSILAWEDSKAIFQRYEKGLAAYVNRSNYQRVVLLPFESFRSIHLQKQIKYRKASDFPSFLTKLASTVGAILKSIIGIPANIISRETILNFETDQYRGRFITSYSSFKSEVRYFEKLDLDDRLIIKESE